MKDKNQEKLEARRKMLDKMLAKMQDKKVKEFAKSIEELSFFLSRKINTEKDDK